MTGKQEIILLKRMLVLQNGCLALIGEIRVLLPETLLAKWHSHAGCRFNLSTVCFL